MSSDQEQEYFSDGLSEELLNLLARVPKLKVAARTSSFSLKGKDLQIAEVGNILKVAHVLEGSVRKSGNRVRITAQLIHAADGYHLWSQTYDRTLEDIFAIQDEIAAEVVAELKVALLGAAPKAEEADPEAYVLLLQARYLGKQLTTEGRERAQTLYQQALAIDPDNPVVHAQLGRIADHCDRDLAAAAHYLERALALNPIDTEIQGLASQFLLGLERFDEAKALIESVISRDPVNVAAHRTLASCCYREGQFDSAIASFRTALSLSPAATGAYGLLGRAYLLKGEPQEALALVEQEQSDWWLLELPLVYHALGRVAESDAVLAELIEKYNPQAAVNIAAIHAYRGELDEAFAWLDIALA